LSPPSPGEKRRAPSVQIERHSGYVEWIRGDVLIADGQRVKWTGTTRTKLGRIAAVSSIPLGYEIDLKGVRALDGALVADEITVKPNGIALYEREAQQYFNELEGSYVTRGVMWQPEPRGARVIGAVATSGPEVERIRRIVNRLVPPYRQASAIRT
jgi:hypothetical protein